jgi:serine/threonine protein kinase
MSAEMRVLQGIRHPNVLCVIGHFQTGCSWIQVSDWFDGQLLADLWPAIQDLPMFHRIGLFGQVLEGLRYCHSRNVFHRNISDAHVAISADLQEVRLGGFDCAVDAAASTSLSAKSKLGLREKRLIPPEELSAGTLGNPRLGDIFQAGVLLYRLLSGGTWPFSDSLEYACDGVIRTPEATLTPELTDALAVASEMMALDPQRRPDPIARVQTRLKAIQSQ